MPDFVRVRVKESGATTTVARSTAEAVDGLDILDEEEYPAVNAVGVPLADDYAEALPGYGDRTVEQLQDAVAARNASRDAEYQIVVDGKAKKSDLVAALEADDHREDPVPERIIQAQPETRPNVVDEADLDDISEPDSGPVQSADGASVGATENAAGGAS